MPSTVPRSSLGYTAVSSARPVPNTMAAPMPWTNLRMTTIQPEKEKNRAAVRTVSTTIPHRKTLLRPRMSDSRPKGRRNMAAASR